MRTSRLIASILFTLASSTALADIAPPEKVELPRVDVIVKGATPEVTGALDVKSVEPYLRRYTSGIKWCYQDRREDVPNLEGSLVVSFNVAPDGTTNGWRVSENTTKDLSLEACVTAKISRWKMPVPKDGGVGTVKQRITMAAPKR